MQLQFLHNYHTFNKYALKPAQGHFHSISIYVAAWDPKRASYMSDFLSGTFCMQTLNILNTGQNWYMHDINQLRTYVQVY